MIEKHATAVWKGSLKEGGGTLTIQTYAVRADQVADLGAELTQGAHRYAVAQGVSLQRTWHTATGRPCCLQNSSQRS